MSDSKILLSCSRALCVAQAYGFLEVWLYNQDRSTALAVWQDLPHVGLFQSPLLEHSGKWNNKIDDLGLWCVRVCFFQWVSLVFCFILSFGSALSLSAYILEKFNFWSIIKYITRIMGSYMFSTMLIMKDQNIWLFSLKGKL